MDSIARLFDLSTSFGFWIKFVGIIFSAFYIVYSIIVIRQVRILNSVIEINAGRLLEILSEVQLILAVVLFVYSLIFL